MPRTRPDHIEDVLITLHEGPWFGWSDPDNKVYDNLIIHSAADKPKENYLTTQLSTMQDAWDQEVSDKATNIASAKTKLKGLGLTDDEIKWTFRV